jgi:hypothetical protein
MSSGFFVTVSQSELCDERLDSSFVSHTPWARDGGPRQIDLAGRGWRVVRLDNHPPAAKLEFGSSIGSLRRANTG